MWINSLIGSPKVRPTRPSTNYRLQCEALEDRTAPASLGSIGRATEADRSVSLMTRNLYVGADVAPAVAAIASGDPSAIIGAVSTFWAGVLSTNFPERAGALADEIADARPLLVGLQEVSLFRTGAADSFFGNPTRAEHVEFDYLDILLARLDERGLHYAPVAVTQNADAELTGFVAPGDLRDIRLTDRDVILARTDLPASELKLSNVQTANFATNLTVPVGTTGQVFRNLCGWGAVDVKVRGKTFRFISAHLQAESPNPLVNAVQVAQARELLNGPAGAALPVVLVGDFNSRADGTGTTTYNLLTGAGLNDAWIATHSNELGNTFGNDPDLRNTTVNFTQRLDLVLYRGDIRAADADVVGDELGDRTSSGLWPSDHAGVTATLDIHVRPKTVAPESHDRQDIPPLLGPASARSADGRGEHSHTEPLTVRSPGRPVRRPDKENSAMKVAPLGQPERTLNPAGPVVGRGEEWELTL
jgi:endonuclease/exonuclease/phosphatase family metal-dependent hydrolase